MHTSRMTSLPLASTALPTDIARPQLNAKESLKLVSSYKKTASLFSTASARMQAWIKEASALSSLPRPLTQRELNHHADLTASLDTYQDAIESGCKSLRNEPWVRRALKA